MKLTIKFTETWMETRCGHCPGFSIRALPGWRGVFDPIRRRVLWQWHKRTLRHKANRWVDDGFAQSPNL